MMNGQHGLGDLPYNFQHTLAHFLVRHPAETGTEIIYGVVQIRCFGQHTVDGRVRQYEFQRELRTIGKYSPLINGRLVTTATPLSLAIGSNR